jgi:hypothetical protein
LFLRIFFAVRSSHNIQDAVYMSETIQIRHYCQTVRDTTQILRTPLCKSVTRTVCASNLTLAALHVQYTACIVPPRRLLYFFVWSPTLPQLFTNKKEFSIFNPSKQSTDMLMTTQPYHFWETGLPAKSTIVSQTP